MGVGGIAVGNTGLWKGVTAGAAEGAGVFRKPQAEINIRTLTAAMRLLCIGLSS
jgi:hypothetical protein